VLRNDLDSLSATEPSTAISAKQVSCVDTSAPCSSPQWAPEQNRAILAATCRVFLRSTRVLASQIATWHNAVINAPCHTGRAGARENLEE
jgi:hypothetical protein